MKIVNNAELDQWLWDRRDHYLVSVKGTLPIPTTEPVNTINVKWVDKDTGEEIDIIYEEDYMRLSK